MPPRVDTVHRDLLRKDLLTMPTPFRPYALNLQEYRKLHTTKQKKKLKHLSYWYFEEFVGRFEDYDDQTIKGVYALAHVLLNAEREGYNVDPCWGAFNERKGGPWAIIEVCRASKKAFKADRRGTGIIDDQIARLARLRPIPERPPRAVDSPEETPAAEQEALEEETDALIADVAGTAEVAEAPVAATTEAAPTPESPGDDAEPDPVEAEPLPDPKPPTQPSAGDVATIKFEFRGNTFEFKGEEAPYWVSKLLEGFPRPVGAFPKPGPITDPPPPHTPPHTPPRRPATADDKLPARVLSVIGHDEVSIADVVERLRAVDELPRAQSPEHLHDHIGVVLSRMARKGTLDRVGRGIYRVKFLRVVV